MTPVFTPQGALAADAFGGPAALVVGDLVGVRVETRAAELGPRHLLLAAVRKGGAGVAPFLRGKNTPEAFAKALAEFCRDDDAAPVPPRGLTAELFSADGRALLAELAEAFPAGRPSDDWRGLLKRILAKLPAGDRSFLDAALDLDAAAGPAPDAAAGGDPFADDGTPRDGVFAPDALALLRSSLDLAGRTGHAEAMLAHLALALLNASHPDLLNALTLFGSGDRRKAASDGLFSRVRVGPAGPPPPLARASFDRAFLIALKKSATAVPVGAVGLAAALLRNLDLDPNARDGLAGPPLKLDAASAARHLDKLAAGGGSGAGATGGVPSGLTGGENLTAKLAQVAPSRYVARPEDRLLEDNLYSQTARCVFVHGNPGVGCSALVEAVARRAAAGEVSFLADTTFVRVDANTVPEASRGGALRRYLGAGGGRFVVVVENAHELVKADPAATRLLTEEPGSVRVVAVMPTAEYRQCISPDPTLAARTLTVEVPEPSHDLTTAILAAAAPEVAARRSLQPDAEQLPAVARLADRYCNALPRPKRAVEVFRWACDEAGLAAARGSDAGSVGFAAAAAAIARRQNVPVDQITGHRGAESYKEELSRVVVGQPEAVARAAEFVALARHGAGSGGRPVGVLLFAGVSGTGKTLLAEVFAKLFSARGRLHLFSMGEYTEAHSVSSFIGTSPGYVRSEEGGLLVNALLTDPDGVFLLDEAEKAHPEVWNLFLNLFDKGSVADKLGRVAKADRAFFILTSNLCADVVARGIEAGHAHAVIAEKTKEAIRQARSDKTGQPYFRPEFLNRISEVLVFQPLTPAALRQIALNEVGGLVKLVRDTQGVVLESADGDWSKLAGWLCRRAAGDHKQGRAIAALLRTTIVNPLASAGLPADRLSTVRVAVEGSEGRESLSLTTADGRHLAGGGRDA